VEFQDQTNQLRIGRGLTCGRKCGDELRRRPHRPVDERFWEKVDRSGDCWLWTAGHFPNGYGFFRVRGYKGGGSSRMAHRCIYEMLHGPIPAGMVVMHTCDTPACVRPEHLRLGTSRDNFADMIAKGRGKPFGRPRKH
jgi:hypothetical protein